MQQTQSNRTFTRSDGSTARVIAVEARQASPQDSGLPVFLGLGAYIVALPALAVASCAFIALGL